MRLFPALTAISFAILIFVASDARSATRGLQIIPNADGTQAPISPIANDLPSAVDAPGPSIGDDAAQPRPEVDSAVSLAPNLRLSGTGENGSVPIFRRVALVFGNSDYETFPTLVNTAHDAELVAATFQEMGFAVWLGLDLTILEMHEITRDFVSRTGQADLIAFYYAGHGVQISGRNLIFGTDTRAADAAALEADAIDVDQIIKLLESNGANNIIFIDACRDDPIGGLVSSELNVAGGGLAEMEARTGTMINYATAPGRLAYDGNGKHGPFAAAIAKHIPTPGLPIELAMVRVRRDVVVETGGQQVPWSHSSLLEEITLVPGPGPYEIAPDADRDAPETRQVDPDITAFLEEASELRVNGEPVLVRGVTAEDRIEGTWEHLRNGLNYVEAGAKKMKVWLDDQSAYVFSRGYDESHAVLVAIDDYPDSTGFRKLGFMESHARALADQLTDMGFPKENIVELYGKDATRERILSELDRFWGIRKEGSDDRLLIYFGGHGTHLDLHSNSAIAPVVKDGILIPYDFDPDRPFRSSIVLELLRDKNFRRSTAHHTMILIDACSSGLILQQYAGDDALNAVEDLTVSQRWHRIRTDLENPHTSMIVAGTGDERALWENGGVFTQALLQGLGGRADLNVDGIISYDELTAHLSEQVRARTADAGVSQSPADFDTGSGRFFFEWNRF
ncbi:caspase family protein [Ruegeria sp. 2205SS24-7]|uniref:caspase family protein n=1 Tax=Ruegeria discodermiae TaxID=3064389 RepID=UPI002741F8B9|nr:caspase family protein [Ruegeria sp. 2205SS24-7]MDP5220825.1 caspase family protein [Ruegeria sp. 2205SS24-7]